MSARLFLLDGYALAYRAFYALIGRPLRTSRGENSSVPWGITQLVRKLLVEHTPEYIAFVLDAAAGPTFRHALYPRLQGNQGKARRARGE